MKVSRSWIRRPSSCAVALMGSSRIFLRPLPDRFPGRQRTSMDAIERDGSLDSLYSLLRTAELRVSEPQKRMRRGFGVEPLQKRRLAWQVKGRWT